MCTLLRLLPCRRILQSLVPRSKFPTDLSTASNGAILGGWSVGRQKCINYLEEELSRNSKHVPMLKNLLAHVRVWQREDRLRVLPEFYSSSAIAHRRWDSKMSADSALDLSWELLERLAGDESLIPPSSSRASSLARLTSHLELGGSSSSPASPSLSPSHPLQAQASSLSSLSRLPQAQASSLLSPSGAPQTQASSSPPQTRHQPSRRVHERGIPEKPVLFVLGDAKFGHTRRGLQTSKHGRLAARLVHRLKKRYPGSVCVGIDEYMTSRHCPRCLGKLKYMRRKPRGIGELKYKTKGEDGLVDDLRVQFCEQYVSFRRP